MSDKHNVRIHIDQHQFESPNLTTGEALYKLAQVVPGLALYREVTGDREDKMIRSGSETIHLKEDEHFHSGASEKKEITIIVNGTAHEWSKREITYAEVVTLDVPDYPQHPDITYSVKYKTVLTTNPKELSPRATL